jgi:hypothetical protein
MVVIYSIWKYKHLRGGTSKLKKAKVCFLIILFLFNAVTFVYADSDGIVYHSTEYGYSIDFPEGWIVEDYINENNRLYKKAYNERTNCSIMCGVDQFDEPIKDFIDCTENEWNQIINEYELMHIDIIDMIEGSSQDTLEIEKDSLADYPFIKIQYVADYSSIGDSIYMMTEYQTLRNNRLYSVGSSIDLSASEETIKDIVFSINSFNFDKNENTYPRRTSFAGWIFIVSIVFILSYGIKGIKKIITISKNK